MSRDDHSKKLIEEMNRYYDARAPWHDEYMSYESIEGMEELLKPIIEVVAPVIAGKRVLEIACGTGNWTQVLAKRAQSVAAIDSSVKSLEIARQKVGRHSNVSLAQCDAYDLSKVAGSFDVLFAADWWSHIPMGMLPVFLESINNRLKPESKAIFLDMSMREYFRRESCYYDSDNNRISRRKLPDGSELGVVKNFPDEADLRRILSPYAGKVDYYEFDALHRWMIVFTPKPGSFVGRNP